MRKRTKSRVWAVQAAYSNLLSGKGMDRTLEEFFNWRRIGSGNREFTKNLLSALETHLEEVDSLLAAHLENWSPVRLALLDRIIIRLAVTEFLYFEDIPSKVTINEYVGLAHLFGTDDSPRFVNGVLDAVRRTISEKSGKPELQPNSSQGG